MMEGWQACFFVLIVDLAFGKDIPVSNSTYVIKPIDSCPIEGYFFKREPTNQNVIGSGPCYLCFCRDNGTAVCWERDNKRCDVERYHHHRVGRQSRIRRSPISLKDIFFQDASKNFIKKKLPQECNPAGESFSDGCPPEDWCIGCTVCDCASNGRWDCHVLSFCDGKEKKKKLKGISKRIGVTSPIERKFEKKTMVRKRSSNAKDTIPAKAPTKVVKKPPQVRKNKPQNKTKKKQKQPPKKQVMRPPPKKSSKMRPQPKKPVPKKAPLYVPKSNASKVKVIRKNVTTHKHLNLPRTNNKKKLIKMSPNNSNDTVKIGEKIVKQVMTAVHKLLLKEIGRINATARKQRSINLGRDCSQTKKWGKKTYNVKSKAVAKIKNKYNKRQNFARVNWRGIKGRFKREILEDSNLDDRNITVIALSPDIHAVIPLEAVKSENSTIINSSVHVTRDPSTTPTEDNDYYTYLIKDNGYVNMLSINNETTTMIPVQDEKQDATPDMFLNFVVPIETTTRINQTFEDEMTTENINIRGELQRKEVEQKYHVVKKHNNTHTTRYYSSMPPNYSRNHIISKNKTDVTGLSIILQNLLIDLKNNNTARVKPKPKISIMKYVRRFFRKIFSKKKAGSRTHYGIGRKEDHTLQTLCENIGPCKINKKNKFILKYKLKRLNDETKTILRSIGIIKGLLHLLDLPGIDVTTNIKPSHSFRNDVRKLSAVLRDNYSVEDKNVSLTDTQITQINYIKKNTQTFIESVKKFADILNETIALIRPKNIEYNSTPGYSSNETNSEMSLNKIKKMLFKYNLIQNTFMRRMYELINSVEKKTTTTTTTEKDTQMCDVKENSMHSRDKVIEKYSKNIIVKLRRLKNLAQVLSSKRKRRNARGRDNALDYLLTLMEYLIKQNHPVNSVPANDGIDFLIDAIRNAPDIKPNKRKFLRVNSPTQNMRSKTRLSDQLPDDSNSYSNRISKEVSQQNRNEHLLNKEEILINKEQDLINKEEKLTNRENLILAKEKYQINQDESLTNKEDNILGRADNQPERTTEIFDGSIARGFYKFIDPKPLLVDNIYHTTTENNNFTKQRSQEEKDDKIGFEKFESNIDDSKKFEVFSNDVDDDVIGDVANSPSSVFNSTGDSDQSADEQTTDTTIMPNTTVNTIINGNESSSESQDTLTNIKKPKLDWIDETFDKEIRELGELNTPKSAITMDQTTVSAPVATTLKNVENVSGISAEVENAVGKTKKAKENSRKNDVMYQKQLAFLTSLDYAATEKTDFEESESGDIGKADDGVPSFFV